ASALFLCAKVGTWNLIRNLDTGPVGLKTAAALGVIAVTWTALAIYLRRRSGAAAAVHLGWFYAFLAFYHGLKHAPGPPGLQWTFLATGLLLQILELAYRQRTARQPWVEPLLLRPTRNVLEAGSLLLAAGCVLGLLRGFGFDRMDALLVFLAVQLVARGLLTGRRI